MGLEGTWTNELGSTFVIDSVSDGTIAGTYETLVSGDSCAKGAYTVTGRTDVDSDGTSIAWTVVWKNEGSSCHSVTAWAGQYYAESDSIEAFWLLSSQGEADATWESMNLGVDFFWRSGATGADTGAARRNALGRSHP